MGICWHRAFWILVELAQGVNKYCQQLLVILLWNLTLFIEIMEDCCRKDKSSDDDDAGDDHYVEVDQYSDGNDLFYGSWMLKAH